MTNRLPLPISSIKKIKELISQNEKNLFIKNPLYNALRDICSYDYADAIKGLGYLKEDYPELMDFDKEVKAIQRAEKRYNDIEI